MKYLNDFNMYVINEAASLLVSINSIDGEEFYFSKGNFSSPPTDSTGFIQQLRDLDASAPRGFSSADMWVLDKETNDRGSDSASIKVNPAKFSKYFK